MRRWSLDPATDCVSRPMDWADLGARISLMASAAQAIHRTEHGRIAAGAPAAARDGQAGGPDDDGIDQIPDRWS